MMTKMLYTDVLIRVLWCVICFPKVSASELYPPLWNEICNVTNTVASSHVDMKCRVTNNQRAKIDLKELDKYSRNTDTNVTFSLHIKCQPSGNITMSWPMKVAKLVDLKVVGCFINEYINDWSDPELDNTVDNLRYLQIIDSTALLDVSVLFQSLDNLQNVSREWSCGHDDTIRQLIRRNLSMKFYVSNPNMLPSLETNPIDLINNAMDLEPKCVFSHLKEIEETHITSMNVYHYQVLSEHTKFPVIKYINYSYNAWRDIPEPLRDWRLRFQHLKYMDLSHNKISEVDMKNNFDRVPGEDTIIDLRYNTISVVTVDDLLQWASLNNMFIDIRGNPLDCSCFKQDLILAVQNDGFFIGDLLKYKYIRDMTCASPVTARGLTLSSITKEHMGCPTDLMVPLIILGVVAAILILVIVLTFRYRKEIKIILYIRFNILFPWDVDDKKDDKDYDAFVAYSSGDEDWVYDYLQKHLETPTGENKTSFKLCLHQRDFIGGTSIIENIIGSIENSRHTIVVLSKSFISSVWGLEEFKHAYYQSIVNKHRHLIIVKYEDVQEEDIDSTLKRCLKTFTYLNVKDNMFLDRLRFALAVKMRDAKMSATLTEPYDLTLPGPLIISSGGALKTQISDDSGCMVDVIPNSL